MPSTSIAETAEVAPGRIAVERRDGRTVYTWSWHKPWSWTSIVNTTAVLVALIVFDAARSSSWTRGVAVLSLIVTTMFVCAFTGIEYLRYRYNGKKGRLEVSSDGIRIGQGRRTIRMGEDSFPLKQIMGAKAGTMGDGYWGVYIMAPGHRYRTSVSGLATRQEAEWLADAIEAEIRDRGYTL